jgi:molybdopterin-binding protein
VDDSHFLWRQPCRHCEITLEIAPGVEIVSIITKASVLSLGLAEGKTASAVIKASSVMVAVD